MIHYVVDEYVRRSSSNKMRCRHFDSKLGRRGGRDCFQRALYLLQFPTTIEFTNAFFIFAMFKCDRETFGY